MNAPVSPARILVVDDDPGMVRAVSRVLGRHYDVHTTTTPGPAIDHVTEHDVDVAILDIRMPEMDGFTLMQTLLEQRPDIDVILMTGNAAEPEAHLVRAIEHGAFYFIQKPFDRRVLLTLVARCLELRALQRERQRHLERIERELNAARLFQSSMLPSPRSTVNGVTINAHYAACTELAGDFYDYASVPDGGVAFVVADVSGHGVSAAMLTSVVKAAFRAAAEDAYEPLAVVRRVSEGIRGFDERRFVTLFAARIDTAASTLTFAGAGHPPGILHGAARSPVLLESTGPLISPIFQLPFEQETINLQPSDEVLVYTDGLIEAAGPDGPFGQERVRSLIEAAPFGDDLVAALLDGVAEYSEHRPMADDITLLSARVGERR